MDRYGRRDSISGAELELISPYAGFGRHDPGTSRPLTPSNEPDEPLTLVKETASSRLSSRKRFWRHLHGGWRTGVALGALGAIVVLTINVSLLIWAKAKFHIPNDGSATVFEGSCSTKTSISVWSHLAINVCSTLLLSASNNAMQVLSAPTRADIDKAHERGFWMDVGIPSVKNLRIVGWRRVTLWAVLGLSSIPLHLFYNSMISTTLSSTDFMAVLARDDFLDGAAWNHSMKSYLQSDSTSYPLPQEGTRPPDHGLISRMQTQSLEFRRLNVSQCINAYNQEFISDWRNVLLVSDATPEMNFSAFAPYTGGSVLQVLFVDESDELETPTWFCGIGGKGGCSTSNSASSGQWYIGAPVDHGAGTVQYCLAEKIEPKCKVTFNVFMLFISVICNAVKAAAFIIILLLPGFRPLITVGDAVASFLTFPDSVTARIGAPSIGQDGSWKPQILSMPWRPRRCRYCCGASLTQWIVGFISMTCIFLPALVVLILKTRGQDMDLHDIWKEGFGAVHTGFVIKVASTEIGTALISNSPQLLLSVIYVSYNLLMTSMMMTAEYNDFAKTRKALRVSEPRGQQRSSYYLQLPLRYAIPLVICSGSLHWLISQSLFQVNINFFSTTGEIQPHRHVTACGWSPIALVFTLFLGAFMILVLCLLGLRKLNKGMPVMRSNSLDIAAACHPPHYSETMALEPVSYGATNVKGYRSWYACFTNDRTVPLTRKYDGTFQLDLIGDQGDELDLMLPTKGRSSGLQGSVGNVERVVRHPSSDSF